MSILLLFGWVYANLFSVTWKLVEGLVRESQSWVLVVRIKDKIYFLVEDGKELSLVEKATDIYF